MPDLQKPHKSEGTTPYWILATSHSMVRVTLFNINTGTAQSPKITQKQRSNLVLDFGNQLLKGEGDIFDSNTRSTQSPKPIRQKLKQRFNPNERG
jgi:hypothetical protein